MVVPGPEGPVLQLERARLVVTQGKDRGLSYQLSDQVVVLGSGKTADLRLEDEAVSGEHAVLQPTRKGWRVCDLGSKNGVFLDGVRIEAAPFEPGTVLRLGRTEIELRSKEVALRLAVSEETRLGELRAGSRAMRELFAMIERIAPLGLPVLIHGESGTGKELLARELHGRGPTPGGPYQVVDTTLLRGDHLRSELFGHVKGAYSGAESARQGAFELADGGTVFLDEVGELPLELQGALLRVLQEGEVRPLGSESARRVRVRVVSATNRDLDEMVAEGSFREDLFYRLAAVTVEVPPLRDREQDVRLLAEHFLAGRKRLAPEAVAALLAYDWPGNVRQLGNVVQRAEALAQAAAITVGDLGLPAPRGSAAAAPAAPADLHPPDVIEGRAMAAYEEAAIRKALELHGGDRKKAAQYLGIGRSTLYQKVKLYRLE